MSKKEHKKSKKHKKDESEEKDIYLELEEDGKNIHKKKHKKKKKKKHKNNNKFESFDKDKSVKEKKIKKHKKKKKKHKEKEDVGMFGFVEKILKPLKKKKHGGMKKLMKKKKHQKKDDDVDKALLEIYENEDGTIPDMSKFQKKKKMGPLLKALSVLVSSLLFLGLVAWLGFFVLGSSSKFSEEDVLLTIVGDEAVTAGQDVSYRVRYRNLQNSVLKNVELEIRYPEGFVFVESSIEPSNETNDKWIIGEVAGQDGTYIDISGKLYGDINKKQSFRIFFNYTPDNFSSDFQQVANLSTEITDSVFELSFEGVDAVVAGVETEFKVLLKNTSEKSIENLALVLTPFAGFSKVESIPESDEFENFVWSIPILEGEKIVDIKGIFNLGDYDDSSIMASLIGWKDSENLGDGYIFATSSYSPTILEKSISAQLAINGSLKNSTAIPGDVLNGTITVSNAGESIISNVRVRMIFDAPSVNKRSVLNWIKLDDPNSGDVFGEQRSVDIRRGHITWDGGDIAELRSISLGESVLIDYHLPVKTDSEITLADFAKYEIIATVEIQYDTLKGREFLSSSPIVIKLNSDIDLQVSDEISQDSDGRDVHSITWLLSNSFHNLKDLKFEADLYGDFVWDPSTLSVPAGNLQYDIENKKVVWTIPEMPTSIDVLALQFNIILNQKNPSQTNLTSKVRGTAVDDVTGEQLFIVGDEILFE
ncbi:MAG: hypothetical protein L3J07_03320 [Candidatus Magasanikbacteria bacterium]|nr:hypothetical protein [Candidatus Magasanikbacteria bacterium]